MLTKTKIALAATLFAATSSVAMAQGYDPNLANRYPHLADPIVQAPQATASRGNAPVRASPAAAGPQRRGDQRAAQLQLLGPDRNRRRPRRPRVLAVRRRRLLKSHESPAEPAFPPRRFTPEAAGLAPAASFCIRADRGQAVN